MHPLPPVMDSFLIRPHARRSQSLATKLWHTMNRERGARWFANFYDGSVIRRPTPYLIATYSATNIPNRVSEDFIVPMKLGT